MEDAIPTLLEVGKTAGVFALAVYALWLGNQREKQKDKIIADQAEALGKFAAKWEVNHG